MPRDRERICSTCNWKCAGYAEYLDHINTQCPANSPPRRYHDKPDVPAPKFDCQFCKELFHRGWQVIDYHNTCSRNPANQQQGSSWVDRKESATSSPRATISWFSPA